MAPKILYDAAEMQVKANQAAEKDIDSLTKEGVVLPRSAEVTCEHLGLTDIAAHRWVQAVLSRRRSRRQPHERGPLRLLRRAQYQLARAMEDSPEVQSPPWYRA